MNDRAQRPAADECSPYYFRYIDLVPDGDIVQTMRSQHAVIHDLLANMSEIRAAASPAPGAWSAKQVLQHVIDTERLMCFRALWFARGEQAALPGMEPEPWAAIAQANPRAVSDLLDEFDHLRTASGYFFAGLDSAAWDRRGSASGTMVSVRALAWIIGGHELHHNRSLREEYC